MRKQWVTSIFLPLVGLVVLLALAYGCDRWRDALIARNSVSFDTMIKVTFRN